MGIKYFDSFVTVGKSGLKHRREIWKSEDVLKVMDQCGISAALVSSGWAQDYAPVYGNERLVEELKKSKRFYGCYTIMPNGLGEFHSPYEAIADMRKKGMVATRMYPARHGYTADEYTMGEYYKALENEEILLIVNALDMDRPNLVKMLEKHPELKVLYQGARWESERGLLPYLKEFPNLHVDLAFLQANFAVETLVDKVGGKQLVFGSGMPKMSMGAARGFLDYADISNEDKELIAGGNLARLCGVELMHEQEVENDFIAKEMSEGKAVSVPVFDSHTHILEDGGNCGGGLPMINGDLGHMSAQFERIGVDKYCVAPWLGIWTDSEAGNKLAYEMREKNDRVYPYVLIDPNYVEDVYKEAYEYHIKRGMPGMKMFFNRTGVRYNAPIYEPWLKLANENSLFALMDNGGYGSYLSDMEELAAKYPNISFFLDHAGMNFATAEAYARLAKKFPNVYLQLTFTTVPQGMIEYLCNEGLADKTLYGTDAPMRDARPQLGWVVYADVSVEDKKKILGGNMQRIADRCFKK